MRPSRHHYRHVRDDVRTFVAAVVRGWPGERRFERVYLGAVTFGLGAGALVVLAAVAIVVPDFAARGGASAAIGVFYALVFTSFYVPAPAVLVHQGANYVRTRTGGPFYCAACGVEVTAAPWHDCHRKGKKRS